MPKRPAKLKNIVAGSITIKDAQGKTRIFMGTVGDPPHSTITLFGDRDRTIEIAADPAGGLQACFRDGSGQLVASLGITSDDRVGLGLYDHRTGTTTELGSEPKTGGPHLTLRQKGKLLWSTRTKSRRKK